MSEWTEIKPAISKSLISILKKNKFHKPTPIQSLVLPHFLMNKDVAVQAFTGSGKTLAFVLPIVEKLTQRKEQWKKCETGAVVLLPTRELAVQVAEVFKLFLPSFLTLQPLIGGRREVSADVTAINTEGCTVVVATPGRLADVLQHKDCRLAMAVKSLEVLIIDEADRLFELGFEMTLKSILSYLPKQRRTGLFSATLSDEVETLIMGGLRNPVTISLDEGIAMKSSTPVSLTNYYVEVSPSSKLMHLVNFLKCHSHHKIMVFVSTCAGVSYFADLLKRVLGEVTVLALHGKMKYTRQNLFDRFFAMESGILVSTDVMARGIDVPDVDWVVQFDPPSAGKCGRTARNGRVGHALLYLLQTETSYVNYLQLSQKVDVISLPSCHVGSTFTDERKFVETIRNELTLEREFYDKSIKAFVSFVRFYQKHECHLIFNFKTLDLCSLAYGSYCLLHLPKMPELKAKDVSPFPIHPCSIDDIPYKDKNYKKSMEALKVKKEAAWLKRFQRAKITRKKKCAEERRVSRKVKRKKNEWSAHDLADLAREASLIKKFRAGKISKEELDNGLDGD